MQPQRLYIEIPRDTWEQVKKLADAERRPPRYQVEHLVIKALRARKGDQAHQATKQNWHSVPTPCR
jgi:hypothetical protein